MVVAAACGFPQPLVEGDDASTVPGLDGSNDSIDAPSSDDGPQGTDGSTTDAPVISDVTVRDDATQKADAAGCTTCDCDKDTYNKKDCDAGADASNPGKIDCDDLDPVRHPGQTVFQTLKPEGHDGDWNCDTKVEKGYPEKVECSGTGLTGCGTQEGFTQPVKCGEPGNWYGCQPNPQGLGLSCVPTKLVKTQTQACL
jgi:hypothetical protein